MLIATVECQLLCLQCSCISLFIASASCGIASSRKCRNVTQRALALAMGTKMLLHARYVATCSLATGLVQT